MKEFEVLNNNFTEGTLQKLQFEEQITTPDEIINANNSLFLVSNGCL